MSDHEISVPASEAELIEADRKSREDIEHALDRTLFVEAGAGTGKTTALVGRIVELVLTPDAASRRSLSQIAAITFTEAAAAELRERVRIEFEKALLQARVDGDHEKVERCEQALADADVAAISTLHSFAQRLLSEFPVEIGVPPRVEVVDEVQSQIAFGERWADFLDSLYEDPNLEEFIVRASILGVRLNGSQLRNIAQEFDDNWDRLLDIEGDDRAATPIDFGAVREAIHRIEQLPSECTDAADKLLEKIQNAHGLFDRFRGAETDYERLRLVNLLKDLKFGNGGRKGNWQDVIAARECCASLVEACLTVIDTVSADTLTRFAAKIAAFTIESAERRRAEGVLEFHDLLVLAHLLLRRSPEARQALSERYRVLMLDEFQDTDPIQISLALLLASAATDPETPWTDLPPEPGRLFMVGDPKQSIYRFRRADIEVFLRARKAFGEGEVVLRRNFRTVSPIIDAVNDLFAQVMPEETTSQAKYSSLLATRDPSECDHRPIVFGAGSSQKAGDLREAEAADVASVVADIRANPAAWMVGDGAGDWRAPQLRDVTILLPTRTSMSQLSHALDQQSIPFRADTGTLVYETQEIKDLLSVLAAIDDPSDEIALVAALRSPLYACGYDDLYRYAEGGGRFDVMGAIPDALLGTIVADGIEHIRELAKRRWWDEPSELLLRLIDERHAMALPAHGRRARDTWRRIRFVVDQARAFSEANGGDLRDYLNWTRLQGVDGSRAHEPMLPEPDDDAVQIMTIHGSKGLEFPITIISGLTTRVSGRAKAGEVVWREPGTLPEVKVSSSVRTAHFDQKKQLDDEMDGPERDRLLYVALTRARDHLIMSGHHALNAKGEPVDSHGSKIWRWATESGTAFVRPLEGQGALFSDGGDEGSKTTADQPMVALPAHWQRDHSRRLARAAARSVVSATTLARETSERRRGGVDNGVDPLWDEAWEDDDVRGGEQYGDGQLPPQEFRRGRAGTAIGSAVHGVLQLIDLSTPDAADLDALCSAQAWAESVPEHVETIRASVESALGAEIVRQCLTATHWKELFVAAPVGEITIEGYVDLLVETSAGLVVVDYKTDSIRSEADVETKLERYGLQGAAYAVAVEAATGRGVSDVQFVFARPEGPLVRSIADLEALRAQVRSVAQNGLDLEGNA